MDIQKLVQENKEYIREEESRKQQALEQLRDWLSKHPFISNSRQGKSYMINSEFSKIIFLTIEIFR